MTTEELRTIFRDRQYHGIVALIDYLEQKLKSGYLVEKIGSSTIDWHGKARALQKRPHTEDEAGMMIMFLPTFFIGTTDGRQTPLQWLEELGKDIDAIDKVRLEAFDKLSTDLAQTEQGEFKIILSKSELTRPVQ